MRAPGLRQRFVIVENRLEIERNLDQQPFPPTLSSVTGPGVPSAAVGFTSTAPASKQSVRLRVVRFPAATASTCRSVNRHSTNNRSDVFQDDQPAIRLSPVIILAKARADRP